MEKDIRILHCLQDSFKCSLPPYRKPRHHSSIELHIPHEIWAYVFELCLPDLSLGIPLQRPDIPPPWNLSQVCRRWREIAISTPSVWNNIIVQCHRYRNQDGSLKSDLTVAADSRKLALQLERSKASPLDILVQNGLQASILWSTPPCPLWRILIPHIHRSRFLSVTEGVGGLLDMARSSIPVSTVFSFLQHLDWSGGHVAVFDIFQNAPCLRRFHSSTIEPSLHRLPYEQLRIVELTMMRKGVIPELSERLTHVETLRLAVDKLGILDLLQLPTATHRGSQCTLLTLKNLDIDCISDIWSDERGETLFSAPNLDTLKVKNLTNEEVPRFPVLLHENIHSLNIRNLAEIDLDSLVAILERLPGLRELNLQTVPKSSSPHALIEVLGHHSLDEDGKPTPRVCPALRIIIIRLYKQLPAGANVDFNVETLLDMAHLRNRFGLQRVEILQTQEKTLVNQQYPGTRGVEKAVEGFEYRGHTWGTTLTWIIQRTGS